MRPVHRCEFSPVRLGALELRHRIWVPATVPWRASRHFVEIIDLLSIRRRPPTKKYFQRVVELSKRIEPGCPRSEVLNDDRWLEAEERAGSYVLETDN